MNLPANKEETDHILFELLEGNLPKQEQEFWYDYALKNNEFARQMALFRKIYMHEDLNVYPDHSKLLRKSPWLAFWKNPFFIAGSTLLLGAVAFYTYSMLIPSPIQQQILPSQTEQILKEEKKEFPVSPEKEEDRKDLPVKSKEAFPAISPKGDIKEEKEIDKTSVETVETKPAPVLQEGKAAPVLIDSVKVKQEPIITEEKAVEKTEPAAPTQLPKKEENSQNKTKELKLKVKPSRKTKPTDFNY